QALAAYREKAAPATLALVNLLRSDRPDLRFYAFEALKEIGDAGKTAAIPVLTALTKDKNQAIAQDAAGVFHALLPEDAEKADVPKAEPPSRGAGPGA